MTTRRRMARHGYSLIEMVLVIGALSIVLVLCGGLLHMVLRLDRAGRDSMNDANGLARIGRQFRRDVRAARAAKPSGAEALELTRPDGPTVVYRVESVRLFREERDGKTLVRREMYPLARLGPLAFQTDGPLVRVVLSRRPSSPTAPRRPSVAIEARLDKDRPSAERSEARP